MYIFSKISQFNFSTKICFVKFSRNENATIEMIPTHCDNIAESTTNKQISLPLLHA